MGTEGMKTSLISREVIADSIELVARATCLMAGGAGGLRQDHSGAAMALLRLNILAWYSTEVDHARPL